jgi:hypothetical protein
VGDYGGGEGEFVDIGFGQRVFNRRERNPLITTEIKNQESRKKTVKSFQGLRTH